MDKKKSKMDQPSAYRAILHTFLNSFCAKTRGLPNREHPFYKDFYKDSKLLLQTRLQAIQSTTDRIASAGVLETILEDEELSAESVRSKGITL